MSKESMADKINSMAGHGTLYARDVGAPGLFRPGKVIELGAVGDGRRWFCVLEASGVILTAKIEVSEHEAMAHGHHPSFWTKKWRDAFASMHESALRVENGEEPKRQDYDSVTDGAYQAS